MGCNLSRHVALFAMENSSLQVEEITVRFGGLVALDRVSATFREREVHGVIGPNGAGKTTLFNVVSGFVKADLGKLSFFGEEVTSHRPEKLSKYGVARTLQGLGLFSRMSVLENVMIGLTSTGKTKGFGGMLGFGRPVKEERIFRERALSKLIELDLGQYVDRMPPSLPYAIQKKVALARALVLEPRFLMLDEPASGLSNDEMDELGDLILKLSESMGIVLVEHHMDLVMRVCDVITVLDFGRVIAEGAPDEIRSNPQVTEAYLGEEVNTN